MSISTHFVNCFRSSCDINMKFHICRLQDNFNQENSFLDILQQDFCSLGNCLGLHSIKKCTEFHWDGVNFLNSSLYSAALWICSCNGADNTSVFWLSLSSACSVSRLSLPPHPHCPHSKQVGDRQEVRRGGLEQLTRPGWRDNFMPSTIKLSNKNRGRGFFVVVYKVAVVQDRLGQLSTCGKWWANSLCIPCVISPPPSNLPSPITPFLSQTMNLLTFALIFALCPSSVGWKRRWATQSAWLLHRMNLQQVIQKTHARLLYHILLGFWCKTCHQYSASARFHHFFTYLYGTLNPSS